jgi:hypothetical protein
VVWRESRELRRTGGHLRDTALVSREYNDQKVDSLREDTQNLLLLLRRYEPGLYATRDDSV